MRPLSLRLLTHAFPVWLTLYSTALGYGQVSVNYDRISHEVKTLFEQRNYTGAIALLEGGIADATRENRPDWKAILLGLLGPVYEKSGKFPQAEDALNQSIDYWTRALGPNAPTLVGPLGNLGELYSDAEQPSRAEKLLTRAISIEDECGREPGFEVRLLTNLGIVYFQEHKDALAEQAANGALIYAARLKEEKPETFCSLFASRRSLLSRGPRRRSGILAETFSFVERVHPAGRRSAARGQRGEPSHLLLPFGATRKGPSAV